MCPIRVAAVLAFALPLAVVSCRKPPVTSTGTVGGAAFALRDAVIGTEFGASAPVLRLNTTGGVCVNIQLFTERANNGQVEITLANTGGPIGTGEYAVGGEGVTGRTFTGVVHRLSETCARPGDEAPTRITGGSVNLVYVDVSPGGGAEGTFNVTTASGDTVSGTFDAEFCDYSYRSFDIDQKPEKDCK